MSGTVLCDQTRVGKWDLTLAGKWHYYPEHNQGFDRREVRIDMGQVTDSVCYSMSCAALSVSVHISASLLVNLIDWL